VTGATQIQFDIIVITQLSMVLRWVQVSAAVALMGSPKADLALRLNGAVLAGALIDGGALGARDFYDENGASWNPYLALRSDPDSPDPS